MLYCSTAISINFSCEIKVVNQAIAKIMQASTKIETKTTIQMTRKPEIIDLPELSNLSAAGMKRV